MLYKCLNCGAIFEKPHIKKTSYEAYYGVWGMFPNRTPLTLEVCPCCYDEEIEEYNEDDEDEGEEE